MITVKEQKEQQSGHVNDVVNGSEAESQALIQGMQAYLQHLPTREQVPVIMGLAFNSILNTLPLAVFILELQDKAGIDSMVGPGIAMIAMTPLEFFAEWFHYGERLKKEPEIKLEGQQASTLLVLTILVPAMINAFVKGALTAIAGYKDNPLAQVGLALLLGLMNMINTLLSGLIPIWKTLAAKYDLTPIDQQPVLKHIYTPDNFRRLSEIYANVAPPLMGGMYGLFTKETVDLNVPEGQPLAYVGGLAAFMASAAVTAYFDVELLRRQNAAMAAARVSPAPEEGGHYNALEEGTSQSLCQKMVACPGASAQITLGVDPSKLPKEFTGDSYLSHSDYRIVRGLDSIMTGQAVTDLVIYTAKSCHAQATSSLTAVDLNIYGGGLYCLVNKAFREYVVSPDGQATLGRHMFGPDQTAALSHNPYVITGIQLVSLFAAFAAAYPKKELVSEGIQKRAVVASVEMPMSATTPPSTGNSSDTNVQNPILQNPVADV